MTVVVEVIGGIAQVTHKPEDVQVVVIDWDNEVEPNTPTVHLEPYDIPVSTYGLSEDTIAILKQEGLWEDVAEDRGEDV